MSTLESGASFSHADERKTYLWVGQTIFDVVLDGSQTKNSIALLDQIGKYGDTTPLHMHHDEAEIFYVIEGAIHAWSGDDQISLKSGGAIYLPSGQAHAFGVMSTAARIITVTAPSGFAAFVREAGIESNGPTPTTWEFDVGSLMSAAPAHSIEILGHPPKLPNFDLN
jgi:mannose-6-phosphate isomerase-like protein (cupin superfamily)